MLENTRVTNKNFAEARDKRYREGQRMYRGELNEQAAERRAAVEAIVARDESLGVGSKPFKQEV